MKVLAIDQSVTATAYSVFETDSAGRLTLTKCDAIKVKGTGIYRIMNWLHEVENLVATTQADLLAREQHHQIQYGAASQLQELAGFLDYIAFNSDPSYVCTNGYAAIPVTTWKKYLTGKGNLKKDTAYLIHINNAIAKNGILNNPNEVFTDDNKADSIAIGVTAYAMWLLRNGRDKELAAISKLDDKVLTRSLETVFNYGKQF